MASSSPFFIGFEDLPDDGCLLIPGRLPHPELLALSSRLKTRPVTWLIEEGAMVEPATQEYLAGEDVLAATFSRDDDPAAVGGALRQKIENNALLIFIPGDAAARPGTACHIPPDQLAFLCALSLPTIPIAVSRPNELRLASESPSALPSSVFVLGDAISSNDISVPLYQENLLRAAETSFSSRRFLEGSLAENLLIGLKKHGHISIHDGTDDSSLPYGKLLAAAIVLSKEIKKATSKKRVGIILPPGKGGMLANIAVLFANKIPVNLNFTASQEAVESAIRQADLDKFITADPFVRKVPTFPWPPTRDLLLIERILPAIKGSIAKWFILSKLIPTPLLSMILGLKKGGRGDDEAILLFTSGSSGEPKGVPLSHRNVLGNVCQFGTRLSLPSDAGILGALPLFHSFGCTVTLWFPIIEGAKLVTYPSPLETKRLAELIHEHQLNLLLATPTFLRGYMRRVDPELLASLDFVVTGAEKLPSNLARAFEKKFGKLPFEGYGLTETSPATNVNLPEASPPTPETPVIASSKLGSVGPFLPGIAVKLTDPSTDEQLPVNESGIIWLRGANVFPGYLNREDLTNEVIIDGWFKTGDVGRLDENGFLYIEGRMSRFSKIAGEMVPHEAVEGHLNKILGLDGEEERKIAVVGLPDEQKGEVIGLLSAVPTETPEQDIVDWRHKLMEEGIPSLWCPKSIIPVDEIPVLASGKLDLKACDQLARASHDRDSDAGA
ncbi:MAG: 2-acyl-glycerophospho-ethanolamine acyltransferase [Roseibacillus sp.]|nr:2-acyl-glycerophospho-ethanolamine acyltransferase [Roseibacillus sp.]